MATSVFGMNTIGQPITGKEEGQQQMLSYHDVTARPIFSQSATSGFPYHHFTLIYIDHNGELQVESSSSITGYEKAIITQDVRERFMKSLSMGWQHGLHSIDSSTASHMDSDVTGNQQLSMSNTSLGVHPSQSWYQPNLIPCEWQAIQNKRHRRNSKRGSSGSGCDSNSTSPGPIKWTPLRVGQKELMIEYYEKAFENFQQLNCRAVAKAYVKLVEPRKQVNHPYNGRRTAAGSSQRVDPELTKPKWWPLGVKHREPDHLLKSDRIRLLVHILCELRESHGITAQKLKEAGQDVRRQITPAERLQVLDEIYYVRGIEELYLDGKISGDTIIHVSHVQMPESIFISEPNDQVDEPNAMIIDEDGVSDLDDSQQQNAARMMKL